MKKHFKLYKGVSWQMASWILLIGFIGLIISKMRQSELRTFFCQMLASDFASVQSDASRRVWSLNFSAPSAVARAPDEPITSLTHRPMGGWCNTKRHQWVAQWKLCVPGGEQTWLTYSVCVGVIMVAAHGGRQPTRLLRRNVSEQMTAFAWRQQRRQSLRVVFSQLSDWSDSHFRRQLATLFFTWRRLKPSSYDHTGLLPPPAPTRSPPPAWFSSARTDVRVSPSPTSEGHFSCAWKVCWGAKIPLWPCSPRTV